MRSIAYRVSGPDSILDTLYSIPMNILLRYRQKIQADPRLTPFEKRVLLATLKIPRGRTRSYAWVARQAGSPKAARAAGQALNKNPYAPHVPCHRVVSADGSIGGYAGGVAKKRTLLRRERIRIKEKG